MAKKDPSAVNMAHMLKRADTKTETHTNGSEVQPNIMNVSPQVRQRVEENKSSVYSMVVSNFAINSHICSFSLFYICTVCGYILTEFSGSPELWNRP